MAMHRLTARGGLAAAFLLVCALASEPSVESRSWLAARLPQIAAPRATGGARVVALPRPPEVSQRLPVWRPRVPQPPFPVFDWAVPAPTLPGALDLVRGEAGQEFSPLDFSAVDGALLPWLRGTVKNQSNPWGNDFEVNLFFRWDDWKVLVGLWNQTTFSGYLPSGYFPGMTVELFELPLRLSHQAPLVTSRVSLWTQPTARALGFSQDSWGALGSMTLEIPLEDDVWLWVEGRGKSPGWVADNPILGPELALRAGLHLSL
jgi:hypothetical protein